ncbi:CmlA/FloR family chloramphenicol efflux MFS transporter [Nitratireductor sp. ZSWI3]|uniref:CmlA/FloR family chloramphenicol efflux MFS transporter n=1 Tax=Nitratireductor sp. ZSWI3 TaxID=2966359 RepID=UPI00214FC818|nr:CmlA/FloR family chloramphenicol efflux MFS transporter [Nitratireductor sp. ZSWI3]MCR4266815.1 CmlA/FloR family chloramphenicol efflux MFS transporter [Nitratireductor sp. ZSWI3]
MLTRNPRLWTHSLPVALVLLAPFNLLASLGMDIYLPVVPAMPGILNTTPAVVQLTLTFYMIMLGVGQIVFGPLSDRLGRRPVLIGGAVVFAACSFALAATSSAYPFVALRLLQAVGASAMLVALFATVRDVYADRPESALVYSLMSAMLAFVPALGPIVGALIVNAFGWRGVFIALGAPAVAMLALVLPQWHETRPRNAAPRGTGFRPVFASMAFWTYTMAFGTAMGAFFVFFSTAPRVLMEGAGLTELEFSLAFATVALVMIATTRFARRFVERWGIAGSVRRGMALFILGAGLLMLGQLVLAPSFLPFIVPMWLVAVGIVFTTSVTANGALQAFGEIAGTAVALHFCIQSLIVGVIGTSFVVLLDGDTAWPLAAYVAAMATVTLLAQLRLGRGATRRS